MARTVTVVRVREHGREHSVTLEGALCPERRRALAERFGLTEGVDVWFEEAREEGGPGKSGTISLDLPDSARKSG